MKQIKKILVVCLAALLVLSLGGCTLNKGTTWIAKSGDITLPSGFYIINVSNVYTNAISVLQQKYLEDTTSVNLKDLWKNKLDDLSVNDWITQETKQNVINYFTILQEFDKQGFSFDEADLALIEQEVEEYWQDSASYLESGVSKESIRLQVESRYRSRILFNSIYGKGGEKAVSDADLKKYYAENYTDIQYIAVPTKDIEADVLKARKEMVEKNIARARDGEDFFTILKETEYALIQEDGTATADLPAREEDHYDALISSSTESYYPEALIAELGKMKADEVKVVTTDDALILVKKLDPMADSENFEQTRESLLSALKNEEFTDLVKELGKDVAVSFNNSSVKRYAAKKLVG